MFTDMLLAHQGVDEAGLADVGVAQGAYGQDLPLVLLQEGVELGARRAGDVSTSAVTSSPLPSILALQSVRSSWVTAWHSSSTWPGVRGGRHSASDLGGWETISFLTNCVAICTHLLCWHLSSRKSLFLQGNQN